MRLIYIYFINYFRFWWLEGVDFLWWEYVLDGDDNMLVNAYKIVFLICNILFKQLTTELFY